MELSEIRSKVQSFTEEISKEYYLQGAGLKEKVDLNSIYSKYPDLFTRENLEIVNDAFNSASADQDERRRLAYFREAFYCEVAAYITREKHNEYLNRESEGKITAGENSDMSFRSSWVYMVNEPDRKKRSYISRSRGIYIEKQLNPVLEDLFYAEADYVRRQGFGNKIQMFSALSGIDLFEVSRQMNQFVAETEDIYRHYLTKVAERELKIPVSDLNRHDILYWMRDKEYDIYFPGDKMLAKVRELTSGMGIDMKAGGNIAYDLEPRPAKSPRAFCSTVRVPQEIYLVLYPQGGVDDYLAFVHELGHALHFANVLNDMPFEYKWYGDFSVSEGYAMTFDHLVLKEPWLKKFICLDAIKRKEFLMRSFFKEMASLRRYAAKLSYEIKLNEDSNLTNKKEQYCEILERITGIKYSGADYLVDVDSFFYCARYIRAWMFQAALHCILERSFGVNWFETGIAGDFLINLWSSGQKYKAEEILEPAGENLSIAPLVKEIKTVLEN